jgi:SAM-dependent methyltransferase
VPPDEAWRENGAVRCGRCGVDYGVRGGILVLLDPRQLHPDSAFEMDVRDQRSTALLEGVRTEWHSEFADATEVQPTLDAVNVLDGMSVCELGCGPGRYTLLLARRAAAVVAIDFSAAGLRVLRTKLVGDTPVALVQADVTRPYGTPRAFDRMLSTLHSNLPDEAHRREALRWMADTLAGGGLAVVSMHHHSTRDVVTGTPASGRYPDSGIVRHHLTRRRAQAELAAWFGDVAYSYIAAGVPGLPSPLLARAVARTPGLRAALSSLFLAVCARPVHDAGGPP